MKRIGEFDATKQYFTHTEWVKAGTGFGFLMGVLFAVSVWFLRSI